MSRWRNEKFDKMAKTEKMRKVRGRSTDKSKPTLEEEFTLDEAQWGPYLEKGYFAARVVEVHKRYVFVSPEPRLMEIATNDVWLATIARKFLLARQQERNFCCVGDRVLCIPEKITASGQDKDLPSSTVAFRAPRTSKISRLDPLNQDREHVLASNMDQLVIVASYVYPKVKWGLIDRFLVLAEEQHLPAVIVLNKKDLLSSQSEALQKECAEYFALYKQLGYDIVSVQALDPNAEDLATIANLFVGKISLLSGHSGVGKSSLINLRKPEIEQAVEQEEILRKGRHTTSFASLLRLEGGGFVIDSPGIRSFLLRQRTSIELTWSFREMRPFLNKCQFRECQHLGEPACAIKEAVSNGTISQLRYKSYVALLTGAESREGRIREPIID
jgi:ribosome biogenesis GTPase / thiamine phosphate phosphatase